MMNSWIGQPDPSLLKEVKSFIAIRYYYDENGSPFAVYIGSAKYLYEKNLQGDIIGLIDENGQLAVKYTYDAWGKVTKTNVAGTTASTSAMANNHLLYRGYYFDSETGLYCLGSRYYDSETGRFINADDTSNLGANGDLTSLNLFTYCGNNPVGRIDDEGDCWHIVAGAAINVAATWFAARVTGQEYTVVDGVIAAATGAINASGYKVIAGVVGGGASGLYCLWKTKSLKAAVVVGLTTGLSTTFSISNLVKDVEETTALKIAKAVSDASFGTGYTLTSAGINRGAIELFSEKNDQVAPVVKPSYNRNVYFRNRMSPIAMIM